MNIYCSKLIGQDRSEQRHARDSTHKADSLLITWKGLFDLKESCVNVSKIPNGEERGFLFGLAASAPTLETNVCLT